MNGRTHLIWSLVICVAIIKLVNFPICIQMTLLPFVAIIGGLAPDLDHPNSMLGKKVKVLNAGVKHRGFLHSVWAMILIGLLLYKFLPTWHLETAVFIAAYFGHLVLDTITPSGVSWFYPWGRLNGPIKSDGIIAMFIQICGIVALIVALWFLFR